MPRKAPKITLSNNEQQLLEQFSRSRTEPRFLVERAQIILLVADGLQNREAAKCAGCDRQRIRRWRRRWSEADDRLVACSDQPKDLEATIRDVLSDAERSGTPPKFEPEDIAALYSLACESPEDSGLPFPHWTADELRREAVRRGIFESISVRHVQRLLNEAEIRPHMSKYWLTSPDKLESPDEYQAGVETICDTYAQAPAIAAEGAHVVSTDEMTGIQAKERKYPTLPMRPGLTERREFEYIRHGTLCLIANFDVVTGEILSPSIGPTRTEEDFVNHIRNTVDTDPAAHWVFVADQLNTHKSAGLVEFIANRIGCDDDLGKKGVRGVLKSMASRKEFLEDSTHRIRFVYTPRHASWLNQIEIWFSVLARRILKRANFISKDDLRERLGRFIEYFNVVLAKPYKWTYSGRPLHA